MTDFMFHVCYEVKSSYRILTSMFNYVRASKNNKTFKVIGFAVFKLKSLGENNSTIVARVRFKMRRRVGNAKMQGSSNDFITLGLVMRSGEYRQRAEKTFSAQK